MAKRVIYGIKKKLEDLFTVKNYFLLPPTGNDRWITKNLGNGMCPMAFFGKKYIYIYAMKKRLIRYLWMLKIHMPFIMPFPRFGL